MVKIIISFLLPLIFKKSYFSKTRIGNENFKDEEDRKYLELSFKIGITLYFIGLITYFSSYYSISTLSSNIINCFYLVSVLIFGATSIYIDIYLDKTRKKPLRRNNLYNIIKKIIFILHNKNIYISLFRFCIIGMILWIFSLVVIKYRFGYTEDKLITFAPLIVGNYLIIVSTIFVCKYSIYKDKAIKSESVTIYLNNKEEIQVKELYLQKDFTVGIASDGNNFSKLTINNSQIHRIEEVYKYIDMDEKTSNKLQDIHKEMNIEIDNISKGVIIDKMNIIWKVIKGLALFTPLIISIILLIVVIARFNEDITNLQMLETKLNIGLSIIGIAITVWVGLNIYNVVERKEVEAVTMKAESLEKQLKDFEIEIKKMKEISDRLNWLNYRSEWNLVHLTFLGCLPKPKENIENIIFNFPELIDCFKQLENSQEKMKEKVRIPYSDYLHDLLAILLFLIDYNDDIIATDISEDKIISYIDLIIEDIDKISNKDIDELKEEFSRYKIGNAIYKDRAETIDYLISENDHKKFKISEEKIKLLRDSYIRYMEVSQLI